MGAWEKEGGERGRERMRGGKEGQGRHKNVLHMLNNYNTRVQECTWQHLVIQLMCT